MTSLFSNFFVTLPPNITNKQDSRHMNVKLHTPKSLKTGSGMSSWRQFLLSLLATTVSIALTFGTAAIIDHNKKQSEKREIVMMVMYDMYTSLKMTEVADSNIHRAMEVQLSIAKDTSQYNTLKFFLVSNIPRLDYTETTERIFSSSIESINTVGNVLFTENVANFYQLRQQYKSMICDSVNTTINSRPVFYSIKDALGIDYFLYGLASNEFLEDMLRLFAECKQMMDVTDEELEAYQKQREQIKKVVPADKDRKDSVDQTLIELGNKITEAEKKLKLE